MQVGEVKNIANVQKQGFKGSPAAAVPSFAAPLPNYPAAPIQSLQAYTIPQIPSAYRMTGVFEVPYVGNGVTYQLSNGHKLMIVPKKGPFVINTCVNTGEEGGKNVGHLAEHLVYKQSNRVGQESFKEFRERLALERGADTGQGCSKFWMKYCSNDMENIDKIIQTQAGLLQNANRLSNSLEDEKNIIIAEEIESMQENPRTRESSSFDYMANALYGTPFSAQEEQNETTIRSVSKEQIDDFYQKYYKNGNMATFIVGDVNPEAVAMSFARNFNKPDYAVMPKQNQNLPVKMQSTQRIDINQDCEKNLNVGFVGPKADDVKENFLKVALSTYIKDVRGNNNLSLGIGSPGGSNNSVIYLGAHADEGQEQECLQNIYNYIHKLRETPISDNDLAKLKMTLKTLISSTNSSATALALIFGEKFLEEGKVDFFEYSKFTDALTKEDLQNFARKYFDLDKASVVVAHKPLQNAVSQKQPSFCGFNPKLETQNMSEFVYPHNNIRLNLDTPENITQSSFRLTLENPDVKNVKPGVSRVLTYMIMKNMKDAEKTSPYFSNSDLYYSPGRISLVSSSLPEYTPHLIELIKSQVLNPKFDKETFEIAVRAAKTEDAKNELNLDNVALEDVFNYHRQILQKTQGQATLVIPKNAFLLNGTRILGQIGVGIPPLVPFVQNTYSQNSTAAKSQKVIIDSVEHNAGAIQEDYTVSLSGIRDDISMELINSIVNSRLFADIREEKNISYSVGSKYESSGDKGYFSLIAYLPIDKESVQNKEVVAKAFKDNLNKPLTQGELEVAKKAFKHDKVDCMESSIERNILIDKYGVTNLKNLFQSVDSISLNEVQNLVNTHLKSPDSLYVRANNVY